MAVGALGSDIQQLELASQKGEYGQIAAKMVLQVSHRVRGCLERRAMSGLEHGRTQMGLSVNCRSSLMFRRSASGRKMRRIFSRNGS